MRKILPQKLYVFLLVIAICFTADRAMASHAMGTDLTYKCLGGNTYEITLTFYRDCIGIPAPNSPSISIKSASCNQNLGLTLFPIAGTGKDVTPKCSSTVTICYGGGFTGIQEWVYKGIITLPMQCTDWVFSYSLCCRNAAITTISNPGTSTIYVYATLDNVVSGNHNSPTFKNKPVPFICVGQEYCFNHGVVDDAGDSLVYELIKPYQTATSTVNYLPGYSASQPLNSVPAVAFDSTNGQICMTPQQLEVTVMAVLVKEYRNGVLVGSVERDMQITVMNCNNNIPVLSGIDSTNVFSTTACANDPICFDIFSNDIDTGQTLTVTWNNSIAGATFTAAGSPHPKGHFCWTPADSDVSNTPHVFTVTVTDDACPYLGSQTFTYSILVKGVKVSLGPDQQITCNDLATIYATATSADLYSYLWSTGATGNYITAGPGKYWCKVSTATCSATDTIAILNPNKPVAQFGNSISSCINQPVTFSDQSTAPGSYVLLREWDFDDGSPIDNDPNPIHTFPGTGTFNVRLIVTNGDGCADTIIHPVTVNPPPVAAFNSTNACKSVANSFTDQSSGNPGVWSWSFGDGQTSLAQNPSHSYAAAGTYTVTLVAGSGVCSDTVSHVVTVYPLPVANFSAPAVCVGNASSFNNNSSGSISGWNWTFGDGNTSSVQSPTYTYSTAGNFTAKLVVTSSNGCVDSVVKAVAVNALPIANAGSDQTVCAGASASLSANGGGSYVWNTGATTSTLSVVPSTSTNYTVTVTNAGGCTATDVVKVNVNALPVANAGADKNICKGSSVALTASGGVSYIWSPGGSTTPSISVSPGSTAVYSVTVTDINGCTATDMAQVNVNAMPSLSLSPVVICSGNSTTLDAGNPGSTYMWSPGGATTRTISVSTAGTYSVTVTNAFGCTAAAQATVDTGGTIVSTVTTQDICPGQSVIIDAGNPGCAYSWSTGATTQSITVSGGGIYNVTITNQTGCSATIANTVNQNPLPVVNFSAPSNCFGTTTQFVDSSFVSSGTIVSWNWNFGNGQTSAQRYLSFNYAAAGSYTVTLQVTSNNGCSATSAKLVNIYEPPAAAFTVGNNCIGMPSVLTDNSQSANGSIVNWQWQFGDNTTAIGRNVTHTYGASGQYSVSLLVTTSNGCSNTASNTVEVYPQTSPAISAFNVCEGLPISFVNNGDVSGNSLAGTRWTFGDGLFSDSASVVHTYSSYGSYSVTLQTTNQYGCSTTAMQTVAVYPKPRPAFKAPDVCNGVVTNFTNTSTIPSGTIASFSWDFGNGIGYSTQASPSYQYFMEGDYLVSLNMVSDHGCAVSMQDSVTVHPVPVVVVDGITTGCSPLHSTLADSSTINSGSIVGWLWDFGDGHVSTDRYPDHIYTTAGAYKVNLTVSSDKGCTASADGSENVIVLPSAKANFTMTPQEVDISNPVIHLTNFSTDYTSFLWTFGDGDTSAEFSPSHTYREPGKYEVELVANNSYNCPDRAMRVLDINAISKLYAPNAFTPNTDGTNDVWQPKYTELVDMKVRIFDRWGEMLTQWENLDGAWDGTYKGRKCQQDVYVYQIEGVGVDGKSYRWTGDISLVR